MEHDEALNAVLDLHERVAHLELELEQAICDREALKELVAALRSLCSCGGVTL